MLTFRVDYSLMVIHVRLFGDSLSFSTHGPVARYVQTRLLFFFYEKTLTLVLYSFFPFVNGSFEKMFGKIRFMVRNTVFNAQKYH